MHDLANKLSILAFRLTQFEKGGVRLSGTENEELYKVFKNQGIIFKDNMDVVLDETLSKGESVQKGHVVQADLNNTRIEDEGEQDITHRNTSTNPAEETR